MANSITDWKNCRYGGPPGGNGHLVPSAKMMSMMAGKVRINICEECKALKLKRKKGERNGKNET